MILISPEGKRVPHASQLEFHCTRNITEYEALIVGLCFTIASDVAHLYIHMDSKLIVNQMTRKYWAK